MPICGHLRARGARREIVGSAKYLFNVMKDVGQIRFCGIVAVLPVFAAPGGPAAAAFPSIIATDILVIIMMMLVVMLSITAVGINAARCWLAGTPPSPARKIVDSPKYLFNVMKCVGKKVFCGIVAVLPAFGAPGGLLRAAVTTIIATVIRGIIMMMIVMVMNIIGIHRPATCW